MPNAASILRNGNRLLGTRDELLAGRDAESLTALRNEITASWLRSMAYGVLPDRFSVPYAGTRESAGTLCRAAGPVADAVEADLAGTSVCLIVSDSEGCIIDRRVPDAQLRERLDRICLAPGFRWSEDVVGTTAVSIALTEGGPALVAAGEHYVDTLTPMVCAAAPVTDPQTARVLGTIGLASAVEAASPLMIALVRRAAYDVERRLTDGAAGTVGAARRGGAAGTAGRGSGAARREGASSAGAGGTVGADAYGPAGWAAGWDSLTAAERGVAAIIAEGATNREAAARLYLSRHTIDFHLRQIFRKLGVSSRVELTRLVVTRAAGTARD
jgi:DNA-binding CsgD family transcriptional regulator